MSTLFQEIITNFGHVTQEDITNTEQYWDLPDIYGKRTDTFRCGKVANAY